MDEQTDNVSQAVIESLRRMYNNADPPADFDDVLENPESYSDEFYLEHELSEKRQMEIIDDVTEEFDLTDRERKKVLMVTTLELGPTTPT